MQDRDKSTTATGCKFAYAFTWPNSDRGTWIVNIVSPVVLVILIQFLVLPNMAFLLLEKPDKTIKVEEAAQSSTVEQKPQQSSQPEDKHEAAESQKDTKKDSRRCVFYLKNNTKPSTLLWIRLG